MDIYISVVDYLSRLPVLQGWSDALVLLEKFASTQPRDWQLPILACEALGGTRAQAIPASAALASAQIGIILIDDMLDLDPRGEYHQIGEGQAANFAASFLSAGSEAILQSDANPEIRLAGVQSLNRMIIDTALGQFLDGQTPQDEMAYWRVAETKSAPFFGTAIYLGALFGGASGGALERMEQFGRLYGEIIQIHDDVNDTMAEPANPDWIQGRSPLPILFAQLVEHAERSRFLELRHDISNIDSLRDAQQILIRCGAVSYCVDELLKRYRTAQSILDAIHLVRGEILGSLLHATVAPVLKLFEMLGSEPLDRATFLEQLEARE